MKKPSPRWILILCLALAGAVGGSNAGCGAPSEAPRVTVPVTVDGTGVVPVTTDLGYEVTLTSARIAFSGTVFTVAGEVHSASSEPHWRERLASLFVSTAYAHPGHYQGGEVTGELPGTFVVDWLADDGRTLGAATLIAGTYDAANFTFGRGATPTLMEGDSLLGHTAIFTGTAVRDGVRTPFEVVLDSPEGRSLVGAPFEAEIMEGTTGPILLRLETVDAIENDTLFDGIDFRSLTAAPDGEVSILPDGTENEEAYNRLLRAFQTHDHYAAILAE